MPVSYLDDSSLHEQMVRFATSQLGAGHLPLTSWFPYLGLGSPLFLHYQSLAATLAGALGLVVGPDTAFRWTLYLLLSLWPVSVYIGARLFGASRGAAAASAAMSPFLVSAPGIGYEQHAYLWTGFGVWTQLWASATLPLAWGFGWQAVRHGRHRAPAVIATALTLALHFETGYMALLPLLVWPLAAGAPLGRRYGRAAVVLAGSLLASAWVIVPLLAERDWTAQNEILRGTALANGYGAGHVLGWLASGQLLDHGRLPVLTLVAAVGLALVVKRCTHDRDARAMLVALGVCLLFSFGRATFGSLVALIPGSSDIFFRRFMMGIQLAALLIAGPGAVWVAGVTWRLARTALVRSGRRSLRALADAEITPMLAALAVAIAVLAPAWTELDRYDSRTARAIGAQRHADATRGAQLRRLLGLVGRYGGGRIYAGEPTNWGAEMTVGAVPVFKYLEARDIDEVGYTLRTASLMTDPEYYFDDTDISDYLLFAIRWLIVPVGYRPPVSARFVEAAGPYSLWRLPSGGYLRTGRIAGRLAADRSNVGIRSIALLHTHLAEHGDYLRVAYGRGRPGPLPRTAVTRSAANRAAAPGAILAEQDRLTASEVNATVRMRTAGIVVLSASYDPGWTVLVDGRPWPTVIVGPALLATRVAAGTHRISFRYSGYPNYPLLFSISALTLIGFLATSRRGERQERP